MNDPIPISKEPSTPDSDAVALAKLKHEQRVQWVFLGFVGIIVLGLMIPLTVWLTRLASGG